MSHTTQIKVRFVDLDPYDHVNHARYLSYFESARIEMLDEMGFGMDVMKRAGFQIVLVELTAGFHSPAVLHDQLDIVTTVREVKRATSRWGQEARRRDELIATLEVTAAFTDLSGRPTRAPEGFAAAAGRFS
jgi:YbgC/YbaW family acyl-CoA thioester hydrolase